MVKMIVRLDEDVADAVMRLAIENERNVTRQANRMLRAAMEFGYVKEHTPKKPARQKGAKP